MGKSSHSWKHYFIEFLSVFVGVTLAFALSTWNEGRRDSIAEHDTMLELREGLKRDRQDLETNLAGHRAGIHACNRFRSWVNGNEIGADSIGQLYHVLVRDFVSVQNKTAYEVLKAKGLELITADSLRAQIVNLYDYELEIVEKLEEHYAATQYFATYAGSVDRIFLDYLVLDAMGKVTALKPSSNLSERDKKELLLILARLESDRSFTAQFYEEVLKAVNRIEAQLEDISELK